MPISPVFQDSGRIAQRHRPWASVDEARVPREVQVFHLAPPVRDERRGRRGRRRPAGPARRGRLRRSACPGRGSPYRPRGCPRTRTPGYAPTDDADGDEAILPRVDGEMARFLGAGRDRDGAVALVIRRAAEVRLVRAARHGLDRYARDGLFPVALDHAEIQDAAAWGRLLRSVAPPRWLKAPGQGPAPWRTQDSCPSVTPFDAMACQCHIGAC